ncbi:MAG: isocitrate/isopropylmalate dehydrogenase family protein [Chloroflexi bacterium]|nr:isocitrate/isopropylmalate dehydrogenase family protein [Chloroflexota bacterium]
MRTHRIITIAGDGIGPELMASALEILDALQTKRGDFRLDTRAVDAGADCYRRTGENISADDLQACAEADATLKAPVGLPEVRRPDGTEGGLLGGTMRIGLDLYANVRPIKLWPGVKAPVVFQPGRIDYVIVRENTEGLYASRGLGVANDWAASDILFVTRPGTERIVRFSFELARKRNGAPADGVRRVTCVDKANVLKSYAFIRRIFFEIAAGYPDVEAEFLHTDAAGQALVLTPERFDVLMMENFVGDLLSDVGGGTVGGIGMCPSGNLGDKAAYFEPIHGSAPTIAGKDLANPLAQVLSAAMMLDHLGEAAAAEQLRQAIWRALEAGALRIEASGSPAGGTRAATRAIVEHL